MYCDNATNFVGAERKLSQLREAFLAQKEEILQYAADEGFIFAFISPRAPHFGGLWEAAVKSAKHLLMRAVGNALLTAEETATHLVPTARTTQQRPQRRRGANAGASTNRLPLASFATGEGTRQPQPLLRETAACLLSQATILARVVEKLPSEASAVQQMGAPPAQRPTRPTRRRPRRQRTTAAMGAGSSNRNHSRSGRH
ncbi:uncharacterized protein LOC128869981 [Anastrepha ludens]|uniref:uncharacterized protein LOC128869981 n=1 Tax=Anastrepha ludens TaxID=28586 RepID=UPI0023B1788B|nr:uncharacterized protein LOC128869981 [Anastrepha ludens]